MKTSDLGGVFTRIYHNFLIKSLTKGRRTFKYHFLDAIFFIKWVEKMKTNIFVTMKNLQQICREKKNGIRFLNILVTMKKPSVNLP